MRRLLTWASKRRHGGIIVIDEAESALGSRSKTRPSADKKSSVGAKSEDSSYSRDCLNVLLSMTGSLGPIMLVLTTSNPSELDHAVLDRMDEIIHLPLPSEKERHVLLQKQFLRQFRPVEENRDTVASYILTTLYRPRTRVCFDTDFDVDRCISELATDADGFSGRELEKIVQGVLYKTYASGHGVLTLSLWKKETKNLIHATSEKQLLK